ncbi:MAG: AraC family transcriptional regulator [Clostridiales bacterium]|nr:AraC family transcriptional regulator [Clostridiales bacterium]
MIENRGVESLNKILDDYFFQFEKFSFIGCSINTGISLQNPQVSFNYKLIIVLDQNGFYVHRDNDINVGKGDVLCVFPGMKYHYYSNEKKPWSILILTFNGDNCEKYLSSINITVERPFAFGLVTEEIEENIELITAELQSSNPDQFNFRALCYKIIALLKKNTISTALQKGSEDDGKDPFEQAITYINQNYHHNIDVDMICSHVNYSRSYFSRKFKKKTEMTITEYINYVRINRAKFLLKNTDLLVNEISKMVGFSDAFYFSKCFKKFTGHPPSAYVEQFRESPI